MLKFLWLNIVLCFQGPSASAETGMLPPRPPRRNDPPRVPLSYSSAIRTVPAGTIKDLLLPQNLKSDRPPEPAVVYPRETQVALDTTLASIAATIPKMAYSMMDDAKLQAEAENLVSGNSKPSI